MLGLPFLGIAGHQRMLALLRARSRAERCLRPCSRAHGIGKRRTAVAVAEA